MEYNCRQCRRGNQMSINKFWSAILIICAALLLGGSLFAGQVIQAQDQQPSTTDQRRVQDALRRMLNSTQTPLSNPAATQGAPFFNIGWVDLSDFINEVAIGLGITPIIIDPDVRGTVRVEIFSPMTNMTKEDVFHLLSMVLKSNNAALTKDKGIYKIVPISSMPNMIEDIFWDKIPEPSTPKSEPKQSPENTGDPKQP
jgi:type II secretory pathway component GspD/PulD (secretin)